MTSASATLWRKVGMWDFVTKDDEAWNEVAFCHSHPRSAGERLCRQERHIETLRGVLLELISHIEDDRDTLFECCTVGYDPETLDPEDAETLGRIDELLDKAQGALGK